MNSPTKILALALLVLASTACRKPLEGPEPTAENTYRPVYLTRVQMENVYADAPRSVKNPGKIYYKDNYLLINERGEGLHVLDNSNPADPVNIAFLHIPGNFDMAVKGTTLFADNGIDLLSLDISNPSNINVNKRLTSVFPSYQYPQEFGVRFECVDPSLGIVVGWELAEVEHADCWR